MRLQECTIRVIDFETTGLDPQQDKVCEVGWCDVRFNGERWTAKESRSQYIDPGIPIPAQAKAIHHITEEHVKGMPRAEDFLPDILLQDDLYYAAHNAEFDRGFAMSELKRELPPWLCTMRLAKHLVPDSPSFQNQVLRYHLKFPYIPGETHRAGHDVLVTGVLLCHLLSFSQNPDSHFEDVLNYSARPVYLKGKIGFGKHWDKTWEEAPRDYLQWMYRQGEGEWDIDQWYTIRRVLSNGS